MFPALLAGFISSYLVGSIPFGYTVGRLRGVDIRTVGSGNIGATNVFRTLGRKYGVLTFILDVLKGVAAIQLCARVSWGFFNEGIPVPEYAQIAAGCAVLLGHSFPVFLGFRGGKGVATGLGVAAGIAPVTAAAGLLVWIAVFLSTGYVSAGSVCAALTVAVCPWFFDGPWHNPKWLVPSVISALAIFVVLRHRSNIVRLMKGCENRFYFGKGKK